MIYDKEIYVDRVLYTYFEWASTPSIKNLATAS